MKLSLNLAQYFSNVDLKATGLPEIIRSIGFQLGAIEEVTEYGKVYDGIVVAKVVSCEKHPNADKLSVCIIDDGGHTQNVERDENDNVRVVCGAPNVRPGLTVAWIPPGVVVPSTASKDPFTLTPKDIRGVVSNGMLASLAELAISDNHDGILEIDENEVGEELSMPGMEFKKLYNLDDVVIDLENKMFTHRPDCFGVLGIARELAGIQGQAFKSPDWYSDLLLSDGDGEQSNGLPLDVKVEDQNLVPRFMAVAIRGVEVKPSPIWLQSCLTKAGVKPINNIVDLTNYYAQLTGQPMHAYDYDKVAQLSGGSPTLIARQARDGDKIELLNGKTIKVESPTIVISTDRQVIGIGGVMGGKSTEVDNQTKNVIIECANFDMYSIRRTSMKYGLFTDAVTRYTKGQSVVQCDRVLQKIVQDICHQSSAKIASKFLDVKVGEKNNPVISIGIDFINSRLGSNLSAQEISRLLTNVEIGVRINDATIEVEAPFWRTDLEISEDIIEEIGRLYGYDKLPVRLPRRSITPTDINKSIQLKDGIRDIMAQAGANEVLTYTFVHGKIIEDAGQAKELAVALSNALSPDVQLYRLSLLPSLIDKVHPNLKSGHKEFGIFELNKVHIRNEVNENGVPVGFDRLGFVFAADDKVAKAKYYGSGYYQAKHYLDYLSSKLNIKLSLTGLNDWEDSSELNKQALLVFDKNQSSVILADDKLIGFVGTFKSSVSRAFKLPAFCAGFELDTERLLELAGGSKYEQLSKFPYSDQDITFMVDEKIKHASLIELISASLEKAREDHGYNWRLETIDIFAPENSKTKNLTFRIRLSHNNKTLVTSEVNSLLLQIENLCSNTFNTKRV